MVTITAANMEKDKRGISRGQCSLCDCDEFESSGVHCDYCGHTPVDHLPLELITKRSKTDNSLPQGNKAVEIQLLPDQPSSSKSTASENDNKSLESQIPNEDCVLQSQEIKIVAESECEVPN